MPMIMSYSPHPSQSRFVVQAVFDLLEPSCLNLLGAGNIGASCHAWLVNPPPRPSFIAQLGMRVASQVAAL